MTLDIDVQRRKFTPTGAYTSQDGTAIQNLHQAIDYTHQPLADFTLSLDGTPALIFGMKFTTTFVNQMVAITATQQPNGELALRASPQGAPLTMSAAVQVSTGSSDTDLLAANPLRRYACISNTHATQRISLSFGAAAAADTGINLAPGQSYELSEAQGNLCTADIRGWASGAATLIGVQEGT